MARTAAHKATIKRWALRNREHLRKYNKAWRRKNTLMLDEIKSSVGCVDCGERDAICLDFDHRDPIDKIANVSRLAANTSDIEKIMAEVAKCDIRCANCHRKKTAISNGWR